MPDVNGAIAGDGPERAALERQAAELGIADRVCFTGVLSPHDAERVVGALDVLVLPSRTWPNWAEQFGRVLIEAMASDVAVVASDSGAIAEVVGDGGLLVPEDDVPSLARAIERALIPAENSVLRARALRRVRERYAHGVAVDALYDSLVLAGGAAAGRLSEVS